MRLVKPIVEAAEAAGFFRANEKQDKSSRGDSHIGFEGELGAWKAWIGFDARVWAENGETPIWIECGGKTSEISRKGCIPTAKSCLGSMTEIR